LNVLPLFILPLKTPPVLLMSSRRGAVKVNPVTGKMEKYDPTTVPEGKHRDGCLLVDDRYVNAAKDLGLGAANGV
jgi:hypothetical protein